MKLFWSKHKRIIWIAAAIIFIVVLFFIKNKNLFNNTVKYLGFNNKQSGLTYDPNETVSDLVNKDTDGDGIPDWQEILLGTDPNKAETVPGVPDSVTVAKLKAQQTAGAVGQTPASSQDDSNLTQTDKFSREFLATVASLSESGAIDSSGNMDQATVDKITSSLSDSVQNTPQRKIYTLSDIKVINDNSVQAVKKYNSTLNSIIPKKVVKYGALDVFKKFAPDDTGNNTDPTVLPELDPIIQQMNDLMNEMIKTPVPQSLETLHLYTINSTEGVIENLTDVQLYNTDPIVAFSGMSKYNQDLTTMENCMQNLANAINQKLKQ
jgi:hypothetical protein